MESRTQGSRPRPRTQKNPRPRTQKKSKAKDSLSKNRHSRGQGQECSRPRTQAQVLSKKKNFSRKIFRRSQKKKKFFFQALSTKTIFQALYKILTIQKILLSSSRGQANFRGLEALRPRTQRRSSRPPNPPIGGGPRPTLGAQVSLKLLFGYVTIFSSADLFTTDLNCRKKLACDIISECYVILSRRI